LELAMTPPAPQRGELRLLIVEDDQLLRENLRLLLSGEAGMQVVAACASAEDALALLEPTRPDVMLSDLGLPAMTASS
jgi:two-component system chemotaxis response regulator CheB